MASNSLFTLSDLAVQVCNNYGDLSDTSIAKAKQWINRALIRVSEIADWSWLHVYDETISTVQGTESYTLTPSNSNKVKKLQAVWVQDSARRKLRKMEDRIFRGVFTQNTTPQGKPLYYRDYGVDSTTGDKKIAFFPVPDAVLTIKYDFVRQMPLMVNNTDDIRTTIGMPAYMVDALIELATAIGFREQDDSDYLSAMQEAVARWQALAQEDLNDIDDQIRAAPFGESLDYMDPILPPQYGDVF